MKLLKGSSRLLLVLIPLGVLVTFLALFRVAIVNFLGSVTAWYAVLSLILALIALQTSLLLLQRIAERTRSPVLQNLLKRMIRRRG